MDQAAPAHDADPDARKLIETLAAHSAQSEEARHLAPESVAAMREAGLFRTLVPRRSGGEEATLRDMAARVRLCAEGCSAAAWVLMVSLAHDFVIGSFPFEAQDEVWAPGPNGEGGGPDGVTPGSLAPGGSLVPTDDQGGGFYATGRWPFNSGAVHGDWFLLGAVDRTGETPVLYHIVAPRADLTLDDNWHTLGLRGTGSVDAVAEELFVPARRSIDSAVLLGARSEWARQQATTLYRTPILPALATHIAAAMVGMARPAYQAGLETITGQKDKYTLRAKLERPGMHFRLAEADAELRAAEHMLDETLDLLEAMAGGGSGGGGESGGGDAPPDSDANRARAKFLAAYTGELTQRAIGRIMAATGARSAFDDNPLQRAYRDLTMAAKHELINFDGSAQTYGRTIVGLDTGGVPL